MLLVRTFATDSSSSKFFSEAFDIAFTKCSTETSGVVVEMLCYGVPPGLFCCLSRDIACYEFLEIW